MCIHVYGFLLILTFSLLTSSPAPFARDSAIFNSETSMSNGFRKVDVSKQCTYKQEIMSFETVVYEFSIHFSIDDTYTNPKFAKQGYSVCHKHQTITECIIVHNRKIYFFRRTSPERDMECEFSIHGFSIFF